MCLLLDFMGMFDWFTHLKSYGFKFGRTDPSTVLGRPTCPYRGYKTHNIDVILKNSTSIHFTLEFVLIKFGQTVWGCQADHYYVIGSTDFFERDIIFNHQAKFILPTNSFQFVINK